MTEKYQKLIEYARNLRDSHDINYESLVSEANDEIKKYIDESISELTNFIFNTIDYNFKESVRVTELLENFGFRIFTGSPAQEDVSGMIAIGVDNSKLKLPNRVILLNANEKMGHQRFTAAHELGHFLFDYIGGGVTEYYEALSINRTIEDESNMTLREYRANKFAAELLMPKKAFVNRYVFLSGIGLNNDNMVYVLHDDFRVSETAIKRRIKELNLKAE